MAARSVKLEVPNYLSFATRTARALMRRVVDSGDPANLVALDTLCRTTDSMMQIAVTEMRSSYGFSWADIGSALGTSRQYAQKRYGGHV